MKIAFLIASLHTGGAQRQLTSVAIGLRARDHEVCVFALRPGGVFRRELESHGVRVVAPTGAQAAVAFLPRLVTALSRERADVVHSYLPTANVLGVLLRPLLRGAAVVWGLRMTPTESKRYSLFHRSVFGLERRLPFRGDLMIANARAVRDAAVAAGMPEERITLIPNGFDAERFRFTAKGRARWRQHWGFRERDRVVGLVGRLDPMKGHELFLEAARELTGCDERLRFVCVGSGEPARLTALKRRGIELGLGDRLRWQPPSRHANEIYSALDLVCSTSLFGEGFPNVLAEASLCGVPCIATDVGDVREILAEPDVIFAPGDPGAIARAIEQRLRIGRLPVDSRRQRLLERFPLEALIDRTESALRALIGDDETVAVVHDGVPEAKREQSEAMARLSARG